MSIKDGLDHEAIDQHKKKCKHKRATRRWIDTDYSLGIHRFELGRKYQYKCPDCGKIWTQWE